MSSTDAHIDASPKLRRAPWASFQLTALHRGDTTLLGVLGGAVIGVPLIVIAVLSDVELSVAFAVWAMLAMIGAAVGAVLRNDRQLVQAAFVEERLIVTDLAGRERTILADEILVTIDRTALTARRSPGITVWLIPQAGDRLLLKPTGGTGSLDDALRSMAINAVHIADGRPWQMPPKVDTATVLQVLRREGSRRRWLAVPAAMAALFFGCFGFLQLLGSMVMLVGGAGEAGGAITMLFTALVKAALCAMCLLWVRSRLRWRRQIEQKFVRLTGGSATCHRCGYSLTALPVLARCPECGSSRTAL